VLDILLIKPGSQQNLYQELSKSQTGIEPPVWAAMLAGYLGNTYSTDILDAEVNPDKIEATIKSRNPRYIAITVYGTNPSASTMNMIGVKPITDITSKFEIPTILIGLHPSALPERTLKEENVDMVCQGEGFYTLEDLLKGNKKEDIRGLWYKDNGKIRNTPVAPLIDLEKLDAPYWDLLDMSKYRCHNWHSCFHNERSPYGAIYTSLGCPFHCTFCNINAIFCKHTIRYRSIDSIMEEIDNLVNNHHVRNIRILDEMFDFDRNHVKDICNGIIDRGYDLNIWTYTRVDTVKKYLLGLMKKSGINWLCPGYESGNQRIRGNSNKGGFTNQIMKDVNDMIHESDINIIGNFMFGLPGDNLSTMNDTLNLAKELKCEMVNFYCTMAYPGSELWDNTPKKDLPASWEGYSQLGYESKPLPTKHLTAQDVLYFRDNAFIDYFSDSGYQQLIYNKFGDSALQTIQDILKIKLKRRLYDSS